MNLERDFDVQMYQRHDALLGAEKKWQLTDYSFLESKVRRPFLGKVRQGLHTLTQISKIRIHVTFEMRDPVLES